MKRNAIALLLTVMVLVLIGILALYSVTAVNLDDQVIFKRQVLCLFIGVVLMFYLATHFDYHRFGTPVVFRALAVVALVLLALVLVPNIGVELNGARRWIRILGFQFQPSELAKLALIVLVARKLTENREHISSFMKGVVPPFFIAGVFAALVCMEKDLGVPVVMVCVTLVMLFVAGMSMRYVVMGGIAGSCAVAALILAEPYRMARATSFLDPYSHRNDGGFHLIQSLSAFDRGGLFGVGLGYGEQKITYLYAAQTDFIFASWAEETGLIGTAAVLLLFVIFVLIGIRIAQKAPDLFGSLLATGITALITIQAAMNMAVCTGLMPTKGLPLPFLSSGGTAQIVFLGLVGILLNVGLQNVEIVEQTELTPAPLGLYPVGRQAVRRMDIPCA